MKTGLLSPLLACALLLACGGDDDGGGGDGSGVDGSIAITDLGGADVTALCEWAIDIQGGAGNETDCGDGATVNVPSQAECEADYASVPDACSGISVAELEACIEAVADDPCSLGGAACADYFECSFGG